MARTSPRVLDGSRPRRSTKELRDAGAVLRGDLERTLARGVRVSAIARVAGVTRSQIYEVLRDPGRRVTLGTQGALLEALCKIDSGEVALSLRDFRPAGAVVRSRVGAPGQTCVRGHNLADPDDVYVTPDGRRQCRPCQREARRRYRERGGR